MNTYTRMTLFGGAAIMLGTIVSTGAFAQPAPWADGGMGPEMMMGWGYGNQPQAYSRIRIIDLNDDGRISEEEAAAAAEEVYVIMDADDDGRITKEEYMAVRMGAGPGWNQQRQAAMQAQKEARFDEMDDDKDGAVTREEFLETAKAHHQAADADGDGVVTPWEHRMRGWF